MKKWSVVLLLAALVTITGCKKDTNLSSVDLMADAIEYTGEYPTPVDVTYQELGISKTVLAFPGQVIVFFLMPTTLSEASQIINAAGGSILAQIPSIGYYLVEVNPANTGTYINTLKANAAVDDAMPHTAGYLRGNVAVMDYCGGSQGHDAAVLQVLQACGGTFNECIRVSSNDTFTSPAKIINGILNEAKQNDGRTTLINLSSNGGLENNTDWALQPTTVQQEALNDWYTFMREVLMTVAALPERSRADFVITIAAGNEHMPVDALLEQLRENPRLAAVLKNNVLLVSTEKNNGFGNYAPQDPDVVVMNNTSAQAGTSLAAPCAMGYLDSVMRAKGISASEALKAIKAASWMTANREVKFSNISNTLGSTVYYTKGPFTVSGRSNYAPNQNYTLTEHVFGEIRITYNPHYAFPFITFSDCGENWTYYSDGSLYSHTSDCQPNSISSVRDTAGVITFDPYYMQTTNGLVFKGLKSVDGNQITGNFWIDWDSTHKVPVVLIKE